MPAHPWELRADVLPLEIAAQRWDEIGALLSRRGDELMAVARRATDGWDAAAADSYEAHRRQVLAHLDQFTNLAAEIAGSLRAVSSVLTSSRPRRRSLTGPGSTSRWSRTTSWASRGTSCSTRARTTTAARSAAVRRRPRRSDAG